MPEMVSEMKSEKIKGPLLVAAAVIENLDGEILLAKRPAHHKLAGDTWEFPGGKVEAGEDPRVCLKREIQEELGVEISVGACAGVYSHVYVQGTGGVVLDPAIHVVLIAYRASLEPARTAADVVFRLNDVAAVKWISAKTKPSDIIAPADIAIVADIWR